MVPSELLLRYGCNPHQKPARAFRDGGLPFRVLRGAPGYINLLDALNAWQLVRELREVLGLPAAASFKHVSPAGAAVGVPLTDALRKAYFVEDMDLSPLATAYARARGADRLSSYGDFAALSDRVDVSTARLLRAETSDGMIAPGYEPEALDILSRKKDAFMILEIDPDYLPAEVETRQVFGVSLEQRRNDLLTGPAILDRIVTRRRDLSEEVRRDLLVASIALKYTQSNSVALTLGGQAIGIGAGQQNRVACVDLAGRKAQVWWLRQHPAVLALDFKPRLRRLQKDNAIELFVKDEMTAVEREAWKETFNTVPDMLSPAEKADWLKRLSGVSLSSDALFPFRDNIDRAARSGVSAIVQTGGSIHDDEIIQAADEYGMVMAMSGVRLFHH
jgi:phosphoribosylaminoimidazolecarboxamide formyltransferase/IMP cyclohydrolase